MMVMIVMVVVVVASPFEALAWLEVFDGEEG